MISEAAVSTPMNGLRLSGPAVQPTFRVTLPEEAAGEAADAEAEGDEERAAVAATAATTAAASRTVSATITDFRRMVIIPLVPLSPESSPDPPPDRPKTIWRRTAPCYRVAWRDASPAARHGDSGPRAADSAPRERQEPQLVPRTATIKDCLLYTS